MVNCSGEAEIITVKSSSNTIRYNTFRDSRGNVTLRAGKRGTIHGNFMFGNGIRLYDEDHKIFNNYVEGSPGPAIIVGSGQPPANAQTRRAFIVHNTLIGTGALFGHGRPAAGRSRHHLRQQHHPGARRRHPLLHPLGQPDVPGQHRLRRHRRGGRPAPRPSA